MSNEEAIKESVSIAHEEDNHRTAAYVDGNLAGKCVYRVAGTAKWIIAHTDVSPAYARRGIAHTDVSPAYARRGIAQMLVEKVIEEARARKVRLVPQCPYAKHMMMGKAEYKDVL